MSILLIFIAAAAVLFFISLMMSEEYVNYGISTQSVADIDPIYPSLTDF